MPQLCPDSLEIFLYYSLLFCLLLVFVACSLKRISVKIKTVVTERKNIIEGGSRTTFLTTVLVAFI